MRTNATDSHEFTLSSVRGLTQDALQLAVEVVRAEERGEVFADTLDRAERAVACAELEFESIRMLVADADELPPDLAEELVRTDAELGRVYLQLNDSLTRLRLVPKHVPAQT